MRKQTFSKIRKTLTILLVVFFVASLAATIVDASRSGGSCSGNGGCGSCNNGISGGCNCGCGNCNNDCGCWLDPIPPMPPMPFCGGCGGCGGNGGCNRC